LFAAAADRAAARIEQITAGAAAHADSLTTELAQKVVDAGAAFETVASNVSGQILQVSTVAADKANKTSQTVAAVLEGATERLETVVAETQARSGAISASFQDQAQELSRAARANATQVADIGERLQQMANNLTASGDIAEEKSQAIAAIFRTEAATLASAARDAVADAE
jgi:polyhydroxyalkanoate synthesis regulator phasin